METLCFYWVFAFVSLLGTTVGEFSDLVCEPSQRAPSQLTGCEAKNMSTEYYTYGFAPFAEFFEEQPPGHVFHFIEATGGIRPQGVMDVTGEIAQHPQSTQFGGDLPSPNHGLLDAALAWNGGPHVIGEASLNLTDVDPIGELEYSGQEILVPQNPVDGVPTVISHATRELAEPTKVRRFLKIVKRACLTPTDITCVGQAFCCQPTATCALGSCTKVIAQACKTPTDHLCPGGTYCCAPTATCAAGGRCTVPIADCVTPGDHLCPGNKFCCKPTATCVATGCSTKPTLCRTPTDHFCVGGTFCCAPTATCAGPVGAPTGCTVSPRCKTPTDHLCPGSSFCCAPTATCVSNGCTVKTTPLCATPTDHLCPGSKFCCAPTATCLATGCQPKNPCLTPTDHICPGSSFCCAPTATCVSDGCTVSRPCGAGQTTCPGRNFCCSSGATCGVTGCQAPPTCPSAGYTLCAVNTRYCCPATVPCVPTGASVICSRPPSISSPPPPTSTTILTPAAPTTTPVATAPTTAAPTSGPTPTTNTNAAIFSSMANDLFPPGNGALVTSVAKALCSRFAVPAINSVIAKQQSRARSVVDLVQNCIKLINAAEPAPGGSNAQVVFNLALGNIAFCDKLSNTILEGTLVQGRSDFCNSVQAL